MSDAHQLADGGGSRQGLILICLLATSVGCAGNSAVTTPLRPVDAAVAHASERVETALENAWNAEEEVDSIVFAMRYNPGACDCPEWEIVYRGVWTRIFLDAESDHTSQLADLTQRAESDAADGLLMQYEAVGRLASETRPAPTHMRYRVLWLTDYFEESQ